MRRFCKLLTILFITQLIVFMGVNKAFAQPSSFHAMYFQNQYLTDPAMAGLVKGLNLNLGYQQQFNSVPGSPKLQYLTVDYGAGNNVGIGINLNGYQSGLVSSTRGTATYAYHLPVSEESRLNFGVSLGFQDNYIDPNNVIGNQGDPSVARYNQQAVYVDGDFGMAFTSKSLTLQAAVPNLKSDFFKINPQDPPQSDKTDFITSASYKFYLSGGDNVFVMEPLVAFRGIRGNGDVFDAGVNFNLPDYDFSVSGMYHTNKSASFAFGLDLNSVSLLLVYTDSTSSIKTYSNNTFEIGLRFKFLNKADNQ